MPILRSSFQPPGWLANGHVQTILPVLLPRRVAVTFERERWNLPDGDFLDLDWLRRGPPRIAVLSHGLEGNSDQLYIRALAAALQRAGWDVLAWNFRGCSGEMNRLPRFYHSGETGDLSSVVRYAAQYYAQIAVVGFSLGGNMTLKFLAEDPPAAVLGGATVSVPVDLAACARKLDSHTSNRIYLRRFLTSLATKVETKARLFPQALDPRGVRALGSFQEFDDRYTAPLHGFRDAAEYWAKASARPLLHRIRVPTLLLSARNDPFLAPEAFPWPEAEASDHLFLEAPESGGHVGFLDLRRGLEPWWERRVVRFLDQLPGKISPTSP